jgi:hypothetical protein
MIIFLKIQALMIDEHSPMPLALSTRGYTLMQCAFFQKPLMPSGDCSLFWKIFKVVLSSYLLFLKKPFRMGREKILAPLFSMFDRWSDLETLRISLSNIQQMLSLLQLQADQLRAAIDFRLEPLSQEVEELRQRYDVDAN